MYLEESGYHHVLLLAHGPTEVPTSRIDQIGKNILFNETHIANVTSQKNILVARDVDEDVLQIVENHHYKLKIADSKEMMVSVAYDMSFKLEQFEVFHVSMHIDATANTNKEDHPLIIITSKDSYGKMFFVL